MSAPEKIGIVEVSPRDGLQNEQVLLETDTKIGLIKQIVAAGAKRVEAVSFVNPLAVPAMADAEAVMEKVPRSGEVSYIGLVLNHRGFVRACAAGVDEINVVIPASDAFAKANQNATVAELTDMAEDVLADAATRELPATLTIATAFGCPFTGEVQPDRILELARRGVAAGAREIALADTIGVGVPTQVYHLFGEVRALAPELPLRGHFHNTRNTGYVNAVAAIKAGVTELDSSNGGIGGCPFAPAATGNIATADLVYLLHRMGHDTGLDIKELIAIDDWIGRVLGRVVPGLLGRAGVFPLDGH